MKSITYQTFSAKKFFALLFMILAGFIFAFLFGINRLASPTFKSQQSSAPLIIIDSGHGGEDGGTQSADGTLEKDINLEISKKVEALLNCLGFETLMTRDKDELIYDSNCSTQREKKVSDIRKRMDMMKSNPNSIFLSIHQNFYSQSKYSGAQVFYSKKQPESELIASSIQKSIVQSLQPDNTRSIKPSGTNIYLLYNAAAPAVMVECGFMSNPDEAEKLKDETYQKKIAIVIVDGIVNYLKNKGV